jgi:transcriptional regulator with XRE-family HTH domain
MALTPSQAFGEVLRQVRLERGLSQEQAALTCGLDRAYFGRLERAAKTPTLTTIWKIANGLETRPSELLTRAERILDQA